jgi:hypothetical protein
VADGSIEFIKLCRGAIEGGIVVMDCGWNISLKLLIDVYDMIVIY